MRVDAGGGFVGRDPQGNFIITFARFDGTNWVSVPGWNGGGITALEVFDDDGDGPGKPVLIISGIFQRINGVLANSIIKWDGQNWEPMEGGLTGLFGSSASDIQPFDEDNDPSTPAGLYVGGTFDRVNGIWSPGHGRWGMPNPICLADCDESTGLGVLDMLDFLCFQAAFTRGDPYACDCDVSTGNGVCDIFDFLCFQNAFVSGCP